MSSTISSVTTTSSSTTLSLPEEIILHVFGFLSPTTLLQASHVNGQWRALGSYVLWNAFKNAEEIFPRSKVYDGIVYNISVSIDPMDRLLCPAHLLRRGRQPVAGSSPLSITYVDQPPVAVAQPFDQHRIIGIISSVYSKLNSAQSAGVFGYSNGRGGEEEPQSFLTFLPNPTLKFTANIIFTKQPC